MCELNVDKVTKQGYWCMDPQDRKYVDKIHFPKRQMLFVALATGIQKPFYRLIEMKKTLNSKEYVNILKQLTAHLEDQKYELGAGPPNIIFV